MMPGYINATLRVHHAELADRVRLVHGNRCPCCRYPMVTPRRKNLANIQRRDRATVAHNRPVGYGGNDTVWVYACNGCNNEQGQLTFRQWSIVLARQEDRRASFVAELADVIETYLKEKSHARYASVQFADVLA